VPVIGVPSASAIAAGGANHKDPSRYHIYRITRPAGGSGAWKLDISIRELRADGSGYAPAGEITLLGGELPPVGAPSAESRTRCA
jgi:hypothetical protein